MIVLRKQQEPSFICMYEQRSKLLGIFLLSSRNLQGGVECAGTQFLFHYEPRDSSVYYISDFVRLCREYTCMAASIFFWRENPRVIMN